MSDTLVTEATNDDRPKAHTRPKGTSFAGLVGVELRRLWWRRLTKAVLVAVLGLVGVAAYGINEVTNPEYIAQQVDGYNRMVQDMKQTEAQMPAEAKAQQRADCLRQQDAERKATGDSSIDLRCDQPFQAPSPRDFGLMDTARDALAIEWSRNLLYFFGFLAFLVGASFVCAEFGSGAMGNWLTFQPRRVRVGVAKLTAATIGGLGIGAFGVALIGLFATVITTINRPGEVAGIDTATATFDTAVTEPFALSLVRVVGVVGIGALGGASLGFLLRHTAGVMGVAVGWAVVCELFLGQAFSMRNLEPWLVYPHIEAFARKGYEYYSNRCNASGCSMVPAYITYTNGWVYLLVLSVAGVAAALVTFRRRDVT